MSFGAFFVFRGTCGANTISFSSKNKAVHNASRRKTKSSGYGVRKAGEFIAEKLVSQRANIESAAANRAQQMDFDNQAVINAVEQRWRRRYEETLVHERSHAKVALYACWLN